MTRDLWNGKPWILPSILTRSALVIAAVVVVSWLEYFLDVATWAPILDIPIILWTGLAMFLVWVASLTRLLALWASKTYILRDDGLEVRTGIISSKSFVLAPAGFSDLEVVRSLSARITNSGDITVRTQGENDIKLVRVRNPLKVADKIRQVMARPMVRVQGQESIVEKK